MSGSNGKTTRDPAGGSGCALPADPVALESALARIYPDGLPNLYRTLLRSPQVLAGLAAMKGYLAGGRLSDDERCLIALEVARDAGCDYCVTALGHYCETELDLADAVAACAVPGGLPDAPRLAAVLLAARAILAAKGKLGRHEIGRLEARGVNFDDLLEIVAVIGEAKIATYAANLDRTRIDPHYRVSD